MEGVDTGLPTVLGSRTPSHAPEVTLELLTPWAALCFSADVLIYVVLCLSIHKVYKPVSKSDSTDYQLCDLGVVRHPLSIRLRVEIIATSQHSGDLGRGNYEAD